MKVFHSASVHTDSTRTGNNTKVGQESESGGELAAHTDTDSPESTASTPFDTTAVPTMRALVAIATPKKRRGVVNLFVAFPPACC